MTEKNEHSSPLLSKKEWIPDSERRKCSLCDVKFSFSIRKHHCRFCGEIVCARCSAKRVKREGTPRRVCDSCFEKEFPSKRSRKEKVEECKDPQMKKESVVPKTPKLENKRKDSLLDKADEAFEANKKRCFDESIWTLKSSKKGVKRYTPSICDEGFAGARGIVTIEASPSFVYDSLTDMDKRSQYDNYFDGYENIEKVNEKTFVTRIKTKGSIAASGRDFCVLRQRRNLKQGVFAGFQASVPHVDSPPNVDKYVRARLRSFFLVEGMDNNRKSRVTMMLDINLAGQLPTWLIRQVITSQLDVLVKQRKWIESQPSKDKWIKEKNTITNGSNEVKNDSILTSKNNANIVSVRDANIVSVRVMKFWSGETYECEFKSSSQALSLQKQTRFELLERCDPAADLVIRLCLASGEYVNVTLNIGTLLTGLSHIQVPAISENDGKKASISLDVVPSSEMKKNDGGGRRRRSLLVILSGLTMWLLFGLGFYVIRNWKTKPIPPLTLLLVVSAGLFLLGRGKRDRSRRVMFEASLVVHDLVVKSSSQDSTSSSSSSSKSSKKEEKSKEEKSKEEKSKEEKSKEEKMNNEMSFSDAKIAVKSLSKIDTSNLLRLYGLYKVATEGPCKGDRPSVWDPRKRAKFDAWSAESSKSKDVCESEYISLVKYLLSSKN